MSSTPERPVTVITGASSGIGRAAAAALARTARVVLVGRDAGRLAAALAAVRRHGGHDAVAHRCDFARLDEVRGLAARLRADLPRVDVLAHNAGLLAESRVTTPDGFELTMQVNHLAGFLLAALLRDRLTGGRLVVTASAAHAAGRLDPGDLARPRRFGRWSAYADSKQANILFAREAARRWPDVTAAAFHPGAVRSRFGEASRFFRFAMMFPGFTGTEAGADTLVWLATAPREDVLSGGYYVRRRLRVPAPRAADDALAARLWEASAAAVGAA